MEEDNLTLLRYMDVWKLESLLQSTSLYFTKAIDLLPYDKKEGSLTDAQYKLLIGGMINNKFYHSLLKSRNGNNLTLSGIPITGRKKHELKLMTNRLLTNYENHKQWVYVNCWSANEYESYAMWKAYTEPHKGIAIKTDLNSLKESIVSEENILCNKIEYHTHIERKENYLDEDNMPLITRGGLRSVAIEMLLNKRIEFQDERELRLIYSDETTLPPNIVWGDMLSERMSKEKNKSNFHNITVNPDILINEIILHPNCNDTFQQQVMDMLNKYSCSHLIKNIKFSAL